VEYQREQGSKPRYVGVPVPRREDRELLTGQAQTVADLRLPDTLELAFTRSPLAHAEIRQVSTERARQCRGVAGAWSGSELPDVPRMPVPPDSQEAFTGIERHALANGRVRFAGEPVAVVAAETRALAEDAAEQVVVGFAPLPPVLDPEQTDAVELFPGRSNMINEREFGEPVDDVFAQAPVVVQANYRQQLLIPTSIEARAVLVRPEPDGGVTVWVSHQAQHQLRTALALSFGLDPELIRVVRSAPRASRIRSTRSRCIWHSHSAARCAGWRTARKRCAARPAGAARPSGYVWLLSPTGGCWPTNCRSTPTSAPTRTPAT
jgi:carbon-monoxide dehydrogenase large subunit